MSNPTKVKAGDVVTVTQMVPPEGGRGAGDLKKVQVAVLPPCENKTNGDWYCVTHDTGFRNNIEKDNHISNGKHEMAWNCNEHGIEAP